MAWKREEAVLLDVEAVWDMGAVKELEWSCG